MTKSSKIPRRILLGPGPSDVHDRVLRAMSRPVIGHLDPEFLQIMDQTQGMLREAFATTNPVTFPISGTGSAGMEAAIVNMVEPGDRVVVGVAGFFAQRLAEQAERNGAEVVRVEADWGTSIDPERIAAAIQEGDTKIVALVHVETSTGVLQQLYDVVQAAHAAGAMVIVDAVASLGGHPVDVDARGIDVCYSGSQKCLSAPPGLAPITFSEAAVARVKQRRTPVRSWYLDVPLLTKYWGGDRTYHHTAPISSVYALHEALRIVNAEGADERAARHRRHHQALVTGLEAMGLKMVVEDPQRRAWTLNAVRVPDGVDDAEVRSFLLRRHGIEIAGGLGPLAGKIWRIGLMGESATRNNVLLLLGALELAMKLQGYQHTPGAGVGAAVEAYAG
ncbi:MAG TPA: alanine--glyoxylate aminotransferase family protein [Acidobacteriota bacterium]